ncbi:MAG: hypothetical protein FIA82_04550 [Melioribacter sp.]|nr:hypothetical protein [Melioribacter sp.]
MKTIISLVVLVSSISLAQALQSKSLIELKQLSAVSNQQSESGIQYHSSLINQLSTINHKPSYNIQYQAAENQKKNPALAILYSMLLPGMGELYAGDYSSGKYFTIADGALWGAFAGFEIYGKWKENDYKSFAESKAGVNLNGKEAEYFANIGIYQSIDDYNAAMELNRDFDKTYNKVSYYWKWNDNDQRKQYRDLWSSSESAYTNVRFVVGALILNRLISAVNAVRLVSSYNKNLPQEISWNVSVGLINHPTLPASITFNFVKSL